MQIRQTELPKFHDQRHHAWAGLRATPTGYVTTSVNPPHNNHQSGCVQLKCARMWATAGVFKLLLGLKKRCSGVELLLIIRMVAHEVSSFSSFCGDMVIREERERKRDRDRIESEISCVFPFFLRGGVMRERRDWWRGWDVWWRCW